MTEEDAGQAVPKSSCSLIVEGHWGTLYLSGCFVPLPSRPSQLLGGSWCFRYVMFQFFSIPFLLRRTIPFAYSWNLSDAWNILTTKSLRVTNKYVRKGTLLTLCCFRSSHHLLHWFSRMWDLKILKMNVPWQMAICKKLRFRYATSRNTNERRLLFVWRKWDGWLCNVRAYNLNRQLHICHIRS